VNDRTKKRVIRRITRLAENATDGTQQGSRRTRVLAYKGVGFGLLDEFVDEYEGLIRFLLAQGTWGEKFSEKYMELALRKLIVAVLGEAAEGGDLNRAASK
jgi:hypothetical protein